MLDHQHCSVPLWPANLPRCSHNLVAKSPRNWVRNVKMPSWLFEKRYFSYLDEFILLFGKFLHFLLKNVDEESCLVKGLNIWKSHLGEKGTIIFHSQQVVATLSNISKEGFWMLLISTAVIRDQKSPTRLKPFLEADSQGQLYQGQTRHKTGS